MFMFTGFSEKANTALNNAVNCAEDMGHTYIGSEHIVLGLLKDPGSVAGIILGAYKINYQVFYNLISDSVGLGIPTSLSEKDITPRAADIIRTAVSSGAASGHGLTGTEHLLTAVLREDGCFANRLIVKAGASPRIILAEIKKTSPENITDTKKIAQREKDYTRNKLSTLEKYGRNLTLMASAGKTDIVTGRDKEIEQVIKILLRRTKNNPCLLGEPGVGKTAVAEGLAYRIAMGDVPDAIKNMQLFSLELTSMVAGAKYRGDFEERIKNAVNEAVSAGNIILFIDEIHNLIGAGSAEGAVDAANILKPVLARGEIRLIGATTNEEYRKNIEKDSALERRFQKVLVKEPAETECLEILKNLRPAYEAFHSVKISDEALDAAIEMSVRYIPDRFLPDKAIDLIDEACSAVKLAEKALPPEISDLEKQVEKAGKDKALSVNMQNFEQAAAFRDKEKKLLKLLQEKKAEYKDNPAMIPVVTVADIAENVSIATGIPTGKLTENEREKLCRLEEDLSKEIIGQPSAVSAVSLAVRRSRAGLRDPLRPMGTFLFCGPTGVGKTALARALSQAVFSRSDALIRLDMSEFSERHSLARLIGSPPGYTGYDEGGMLVNRIRKNPYCVILFDEIEKAHPDIFNFLLPLLEDGILTASDGRTADCRNSIVILTSNCGARIISDERQALGFGEDDGRGDDGFVRKTVEKELKKVFSPEFLNRIDETVIFSRLSEAVIEKIAKKMLGTIKQRLKKQGIVFEADAGVYSFLARKGYDKSYGARNLRRLIVNTVETPLSEKIYENDKVGKIYCSIRNDEVTFDII